MRQCRVLLLLLIGMLSGGLAGTPQAAAAAAHTVHLVNIGWHVGIVLPVDAALRRNLPEVAGFPGAAFLEIGWGDETFYRAKETSAAMALEAAFSPGPAVVHVFGFSQPVAFTFPDADILTLSIEEPGYIRLLRHIHKSFGRNGDGSGRTMGPGLHGAETSRFYAGTGRFHLFNTCNTWTAEAIAAAGLAIEPQGIITAGGLMNAAREALGAR